MTQFKIPRPGGVVLETVVVAGPVLCGAGVREKARIDSRRRTGSSNIADRVQLVLIGHAPVVIAAVASRVDCLDVMPGVGVCGVVQAGFSRLGLPQQVRFGVEYTRIGSKRDGLEFAVVWIWDVVRIAATGDQQQARKCQCKSERFHIRRAYPISVDLEERKADEILGIFPSNARQLRGLD